MSPSLTYYKCPHFVSASGTAIVGLGNQGFMFCQPWRHGWSFLGLLTTLTLGAGGTGRETLRVGSRVRVVRRPKRSEEHTSELQSQSNLVCRLLLEKKKNIEQTLATYEGGGQ